MLFRSTLTEYREGTLFPSRFGVWTSSVPPIKDFTVNRRTWWHGGLTLPWETAQQATSCNGPALKKFPISIAWQEFDHDSGMVFSLSSISRVHLCVAPSLFIPFPNSSAAFVTSSELSDLIWYSSDLMECTFFTSSTIARLSAQRRKASWDYIFAFYGRCVFYWLIHWLNWYHWRT